MQWVCSLRDSLQGPDELYASYPPYEPASHFPQFKPCCTQKGQATKATRRLHCYICNFLRVAQATLQCKSRIGCIHAPFRDFLRITTTRGTRNPARLWKGARFCGKHSRNRMKSGPNVDSGKTHSAPNHFQNRPTVSGLPELSNSPYCREMTPRSVSPFTKNCMASATSSSPMIRTRIRIPVSPSTVFTLPAPASTR